ncbi:MAG TPA: TIGR01777 family oxidoreductase [Planctomycetota bacterium]|nr:TIGR01777 family oxidoreductase [Planctomycetota bacterium]
MKPSRKILVTGGTGFIGSRLINALVAHGDGVTIVSREPERHRNARSGVDYADWLPDLARYQAVVNLAGEPIFGKRWNAEQKARVRSSRVEGTRRLVEAMRTVEKRPAVLVSASAVGYYGDRGAELLPESAPPGNDFMAEVCKAWEAEAQRAEELGVRVVCMRFGIVLGRDGGALQRMLPPFKLGFGGPIGSGSQYMSWVHLKDLIGLILFALDRADLRGAVNGTAPGSVTNREFSRALGRVLRRPAFLPVPPAALRLAFGEVAEVLTASQRCVPDRALGAGHVYGFPDAEGALRDILA